MALGGDELEGGLELLLIPGGLDVLVEKEKGDVVDFFFLAGFITIVAWLFTFKLQMLQIIWIKFDGRRRHYFFIHFSL